MENNNFDIPSFTLSDFRRIARRKLNGRWGTALLPAVLIMVVVLLPQVFQYVSLMATSVSDLQNATSFTDYLYSMQAASGDSTVPDTILSLVQLFFTGAFEISMAVLCLRILRNEEISPSLAVSGLKQFGQSLGVYLLVAIYSALWSLITVLPGTIILVLALSTTSFPVVLLGMIVFIGAFAGYIARVLRYGMVYFIAADDSTLPVSHVIRSSVAMMKGSVGRYFLLQLTFLGWSVLASIPLGLGFGFLYVNHSAPVLGMSLAAYALIAVGCFTTALLNLYLNTALAVLYSTLSGNIRPGGQEVSVDGNQFGETVESLTDPEKTEDSDKENAPVFMPPDPMGYESATGDPVAPSTDEPPMNNTPEPSDDGLDGASDETEINSENKAD